MQGARLARHAARDQAYVAGAIGPLGVRIEPWGKTGVDEAQAYFAEQAAALLEGGVDLFVLETFRDLNEIGAAIRAVRSLCALPIVAQVTTEEDGNTLDGAASDLFVPELERARRGRRRPELQRRPGGDARDDRADVAGRARAAVGAAERRAAARGRGAEHLSLFARVHGVLRRRFVQRRRAAGRRLLRHDAGAHQADSAAVRAAAPARRAPDGGRRRRGAGEGRRRRRRSRRWRALSKSRMAHALARGAFVVSLELLPPRGHRTDDAARRRCGSCASAAIDLVNIPDGPRASGRMSALATAMLVQQAGLETILHYTCRDRNLLGMQSDLLGAQSMGVRNLLIVTGDPPAMGDYPDATAVFDVDSIGLTNVVARLNRGIDIGGQAIGQPTAFHIGVAANPGALDLDEEVRRFRYKVEAGAEFAVTQPVFEVDELVRVPRGTRTLRRADDSGAGRHHAAREPAPGRVHGQRGAGRERAGRGAGTDAARGCRRPARPLPKAWRSPGR